MKVKMSKFKSLSQPHPFIYIQTHIHTVHTTHTQYTQYTHIYCKWIDTLLFLKEFLDLLYNYCNLDTYLNMSDVLAEQGLNGG